MTKGETMKKNAGQTRIPVAGSRLVGAIMVVCFLLAHRLMAQDELGWDFLELTTETTNMPGNKSFSDAPGTTVTTNETEATAEIVACARALQYDPLLIYEYVRNHIQFGPPTYGIHNGAHGCLMAGRGNDADESALLASLLRVAGYTTRFAQGQVTYAKADLARWLGVGESYVPTLVYNAGNPQVGSSGTNYVMTRFWVEILLSNTWYRLDPAFKEFNSVNSLDLASAMGYSQTQFMSMALQGATSTTDYVQNLNETNIASALTTYSTNLLASIKATAPDANLSELLDGRKAVPIPLAPLGTNLPHALAVTDVNTVDHFQTNLVATVRIQYAGIDTTLKGPAMAARRLSLTHNATDSYKPQLWLDGKLMATGGATVVSNAYTLRVDVDNPYVVAGYADKTALLTLRSGSTYVLICDFEGSSPCLVAKYNRSLSRNLLAGRPATDETVLAGGLHVAGLSALRQWQLSRQMLGRLTHCVSLAHFFVGVIGQESSYFVDVGVGVSQQSETGSTEDANAWKRAAIFCASSLEHGVLEQTQDKSRSCVSTIKLLQINNTNGFKTFLATSNNWSSVVRPALTNYASLASLNTWMGTPGNMLLLPQQGSNVVRSWHGVGYFQFSGSTILATISGGLNGGYGTTVGLYASSVARNICFNAYDAQPYSVPVTTSLDPIDLHTGEFLAERGDLTVGSDGAGSLGLTRKYNSGRASVNGPVGLGWTHNHDIRANTLSHGDLAFGERRPVEAVALMAQGFVTLDLLRGTPDVKQWTAAALATKWGMDQAIEGSVLVQLGDRALEFAHLPDGSYVAPPGVTATLAKQVGQFVLDERYGTRWTFNTNGTLALRQDADSNTVRYAYNASTNVTSVSNSFGRTLSFLYSASGLLTNVVEGTGRSVGYLYSASNLVTYVDPGANAWTYTYDTNNWLKVTRDPLSRLTVSNAYNGLGQVESQMNGASNVWNFYISGWRGVEEDPQGGRTVHYFDDDGRNLGTQDALSNRTYRIYDAQGHLITNIDARGYATVFQYDNDHNVTNRIDALGNRTAYAYDSQFRLTSVTDPLGNITRYGYDSKHHVTNITDALNNVSTMGYTSKGLLQQLTEGNGRRTAAYTYDSYGNQITLARTDGGTISNQYDSAGNLVATVDANGRTNRFTWDKRRLLTSDIDAAGFTASNVFDAAGLPTKTIDRNGNTNQTSYTATYKPNAITLANGGTIQNRYDSRDGLVSVTDPLSHVTSNRFDKAGRRIAVIDALGNQTSFALDANGNVTAQTNALGHVTHYAFDPLNRPTNTWDVLPGGTRTVASVFDAAGRLISTTDADGFTTQFQYDALHRKTALIKPDGSSEHFEYDALNNLTAFVNGEGKRMAFAYDAMNRHRATTNAVGNAASYSFDSVGNRLSRLDANGTTTQYRYDSVNNLTNITYPGSITVRFAYNGNRLPTNMVDTIGTNRWQYDRMNRLTNVVASGAGAPTRQVAYAYDLAGNRTAVTFADSKLVAYQFDPLNRVTNVTDWASRKTGFTYDTLSRKTGIAYPNSASGTWDWDDANRLSRIRYAGGGSNFIDRTYTYALAGDSTAMDVAAGLLPQLTAAIQQFSQNEADELSQISGKATPDAPAWATSLCAGDPNGNLTNAAGMLLAYDFENRLTNAVSGSTTTVATYDGQGSRVKLVAITAGQTNVTWFVLDYADPLRRPLAELDSAGNPIRYFVWGRGLVAQVETNGTIRYFHADGQGSTLALTDNAGTLTDQWFLSPYGQTLNRTGTTVTPFVWLGGYAVRADASGLFFMRHRYYHPGLMRFVSADPIGLGGGGNLFMYGNGNPLLWHDPYGLCSDGYYLQGRPQPYYSQDTLSAPQNDNVQQVTDLNFGVPADPASPFYAVDQSTAGVNEFLIGTAVNIAVPIAVGRAATAAESSTALSTYRVTAPGETFIRYESGNPAFTRITPPGGVTPGTFAAPASEGIVPVAERVPTYNLPSPEIPRPNAITLTPPAGTPIIGPRPVAGGTGNEVNFWMGY
jgi:RHS repeat-associated protein